MRLYDLALNPIIPCFYANHFCNHRLYLPKKLPAVDYSSVDFLCGTFWKKRTLHSFPRSLLTFSSIWPSATEFHVLEMCVVLQRYLCLSDLWQLLSYCVLMLTIAGPPAVLGSEFCGLRHLLRFRFSPDDIEYNGKAQATFAIYGDYQAI